ncbi:MAG: flagellar filament capping protein FliD [Gammaproteobacteria bacterium]
MTISSSNLSPTLSAPGIGTGLDVSSIVSQLMAVASQPMQALQAQQSGIQAEVSGLGQLSSSLSTFQTALQGLTLDQFQAHTATSADTTKFTASADGTAVVGSYQIGVTSLAQAQQMASAAFADSTTTTVGNPGDTMTIQVGSSSSNAFTVAIGGQTLTGIADAINNATNNTGASASILHTDAGYQLVLSSNQTGTANALTLSFANSSGTAITDPLSLATTQAAADAVIQVNGQQATRSSNTISDVIQGVTLNLVGTSATGVTTALTVGQDPTTVTKSIQSFVDAYNALQKSLGTLQTGSLSGDGTVSMVKSQLLGVINTPATGVSSTYSYLAEIGVSIQKDGTMGIDTTQLNTALSTDPQGVARVFADSTQGFATRLAALAGQLTGPNGMVASQTQGLNSSISMLQDQIDNQQQMLNAQQTALMAQYSSLDALLGTMQTTSSFLSQQLSTLR